MNWFIIYELQDFTPQSLVTGHFYQGAGSIWGEGRAKHIFVLRWLLKNYDASNSKAKTLYLCCYTHVYFDGEGRPVNIFAIEVQVGHWPKLLVFKVVAYETFYDLFPCWPCHNDQSLSPLRNLDLHFFIDVTLQLELKKGVFLSYPSIIL